MTKPASTFPRAVYAAIAAMLLLGGGILALHPALRPQATPVTPIAALRFLILIAAGAYLVLHYRYQGHIEAIDLIEAALAPAIVALPAPQAIVLAAAGVAIANAVRRNRPVKALFNIGQAFAACGVGTLVYHAIALGASFSGRNAGALAVALLTIAGFNHLSLAFVIGLSQRQPMRRVLGGLGPVILPGWIAGSAVNVSFGLLFAAAYQWSPAVLLIALVPLTALHLAFRAYAAATADEARLRGLQLATQSLARPVDPFDAFPDFVARVRESFECRAVDLVLFDGARRRVIRAEEGIEPRTWTEPADLITVASTLAHRHHTVRLNARTANSADASLLATESRRDCLTTPLLDGDVVLGILCTYDGNGVEAFQRAEATVLEALGREVTVAIQKSALLGEVFEERRKLSEIIQHTSDGILTISAEGEVLVWSPGLEHISGYLGEEMIGTRNLGALRPRDAEGCDLMMERWTTKGELPSDLQIVARDGEQRWLSCSYSTVNGSDGRPSVLVVVARDATGQHEVERLKDDFVATVSHELRTPLTPMKAWANTLLHLGDKLDEDQRREGLTTVLRQADRLERLITNLLEVSKIERGIVETRAGVVDARTAVSKLVQEARVTNPARAITFESGRGLFRVCGDELWIEQIVSNLLSNAIKYAPAGEPIDVHMIESPGVVRVEVSDRGPGIPASQSEKIFNRFHRLGDHLTRAQGGAGLGLYIGRRLAKAIGATLEVESRAGGGATFVLTLQAANQLAIVLEDAEPAAHTRTWPARKSAKS